MRSRLIFLTLFVALSLATVFAQNVASISGRVTDSSGGILPGATVEVKNLQTAALRTVLTDDEGRYRARDLSLGTYEIHVQMPGFQTLVRSGIELTLGREAVVDAQLNVGEVAEEVVVTGDAPLVETTHSEMRALVSRDQIANLPLNARDFSQLIALQAGTTNYRNQTGDSVSGKGARISVSGVRPTSNSYTLDGTDINTPSGVMPAGVTGATLGVEAIREFSILTSNYSAQFGRAAGANIVAVTRSGSNELHGTLFYYHRNDNLDARNFFDEEKPEFKRNQFGFSLGGPIRRNKTFFFSSYEGLRERLPLTLRGNVPTAAARLGILPDRIVTVQQVTKPYLDLYPLPNGRDFGDGTAEYIRSANQPTDQDYLVARVDHQLSEDHSLFVRYTIDDSELVSPTDTVPLFADIASSRNQYVTIEGKSVLSPRVMNLARIGFSRFTLLSDLTPLNPPPTSLNFISGRPFGSISITGVAGLTGYGGNPPRDNFLNTYQLYDDVSFDKGRHSLKFGGAVEWFAFNKRSSGRYGGSWEFGSLVDFLENRTPRRLRTQGIADPFRSFEQWLVALYIHDDFQVRPNLTLNLGVRYEAVTVPTERHGRVANLRTFRDLETTVGDPLWDNPSGDDFAPRIGLAWDPTGSGKLSIRAGFGVFFEPIMIKQVLNVIDRQPPFWNEIDATGSALVGVFPKLDAHLERLGQGPQSIHSTDFHLKNPYTLQQSLSVQRLFGNNLMVEIAYTGTRGVHLTSRTDMALPEPTILPDGRTFYAPDAVPVNPKFGRFDRYMTGGSSNYHAFKTTVQRRWAQGLQFQGSYTWSKAMDIVSAHLAGELGNTSILNPWDQQADYGLADFHVAHNFVSNFGYELPFGRDLGGVAGQFLKGWQINGIFIATTGTPDTISADPQLVHPLVRRVGRPSLKPGGNNNPVLGGPDRYFDSSHFVPPTRGFYGNLGRNTVIGPGLVMLDFSVIKNFPVGQDQDRRVQFRAEFFNIANRANFGLPSTSVLDRQGRLIGQAGRINNTVTSARQIQLALRFEF